MLKGNLQLPGPDPESPSEDSKPTVERPARQRSATLRVEAAPLRCQDEGSGAAEGRTLRRARARAARAGGSRRKPRLFGLCHAVPVQPSG